MVEMTKAEQDEKSVLSAKTHLEATAENKETNNPQAQFHVSEEFKLSTRRRLLDKANCIHPQPHARWIRTRLGLHEELLA